MIEGRIYRTLSDGTTEVLYVYRNPVPGERPTWTASRRESLLSDFRRLNATLSSGSFPAFSPDALETARKALNGLDMRKDEDVDEWARRLAEGLEAATD